MTGTEAKEATQRPPKETRKWEFFSPLIEFFKLFFCDHQGKPSSSRILAYAAFALIPILALLGARHPTSTKLMLGVIDNMVWMIVLLVLWGQGSKAVESLGVKIKPKFDALGALSFATETIQPGALSTPPTTAPATSSATASTTPTECKREAVQAGQVAEGEKPTLSNVGKDPANR